MPACGNIATDTTVTQRPTLPCVIAQWRWPAKTKKDLRTCTVGLSRKQCRTTFTGGVVRLRTGPTSRLAPPPRAAAHNKELLVADVLLLLSYASYKQLTAIILSPSFPGWLAPLEFSPSRLLEFVCFSATVSGTWVAVGWLVGAYRTDATADLPTALARASLTWLCSMPVAAAQLVLLTAAEDGTLVGSEGFATALPLAASGPGEPFVTAVGLMGLMAIWRAFYATHLDFWNFRSVGGGRLNRSDDERHFADALRVALLLSVAGCVLLQALGRGVGEEQLQHAVDAWQLRGP